MFYSGENFKALFFLIVAFLTLYFCGCTEEPGESSVKLTIDAINKLRADYCQCGSTLMEPAAAVTWNDELANAALAHAKDMSDRKYFDHVSPDGISPNERVMMKGYTGSHLFENIGKGYSGYEDVVVAWKNSESHCQAMMSPDVNEIGIATVDQFWVLELGKK